MSGESGDGDLRCGPLEAVAEVEGKNTGAEAFKLPLSELAAG